MILYPKTTARFLHDRESVCGTVSNRPSAAEVTSVSAVCLCRGSIVAMKQQEWDQEGRKGLRGGLSGRKTRDKKGEREK